MKYVSLALAIYEFDVSGRVNPKYTITINEHDLNYESRLTEIDFTT